MRKYRSIVSLAALRSRPYSQLTARTWSRNVLQTIGAPLTVLVVISIASASSPRDVTTTDFDAQAMLHQHCIDCHGAENAEGNLQVDLLPALDGDAKRTFLERVQEEIYFGRMPPVDNTQPSEKDKDSLLSWLSKELKSFGPSKLEEKLRFGRPQHPYQHRLVSMRSLKLKVPTKCKLVTHVDSPSVQTIVLSFLVLEYREESRFRK